MKNLEQKGLLGRACVFVLAVVFLVMPARLLAQSLNSNPPPFDFNDAFYNSNGINVTQLDSAGSARFGLFRLTGPPAGPGQVNWVVDNSNTDPTRNNIRILATTGGYRDSDGSPTQFISIIAFALNSSFFTGATDARGNTMQNIVGNFEAYAGVKQNVNGVLAPTPCGSLHDPTLAANPCFPVTSVATPNLRQDWRFSTNRTRLDGSAPFGYFCDDILGMWIITYFWYTQFAVGGVSSTGQTINPTATCQTVLAAAASQNGTNLDGTPIIHTGSELHFTEGVAQASECVVSTSNCIFGLPLGAQPPLTAPCGAEGNLAVNGADGGAVWIVCPAIPDPTTGAITQDAFLDSVKLPSGRPLDPRITDQFNCLQQRGQFCR